MCIGAGYVYLGLLGTAIVLLTLVGLTFFQNYIDDYHKIKEYKIQTKSEEEFDYCQTLFSKFGLKYSISKQQALQGMITTTWWIKGKNMQHEMLINQLMNDEVIKTFQF